MLLDQFMPVFDATRIEHRVIDAPPERVYAAAVHADFAEAVRRQPVARVVFALRAAAERLVRMLRGEPEPPPPEAFELRLETLGEHGEWVRLGEDAPREFVFGAVGRFWGGETTWEPIDASAFPAFDRPGFAKIAASLSLRPYGDARTLLTYEARTRATDDAARRAFLRYWWVVTPGVGIVMRAALSLIADEA